MTVSAVPRSILLAQADDEATEPADAGGAAATEHERAAGRGQGEVARPGGAAVGRPHSLVHLRHHTHLTHRTHAWLVSMARVHDEPVRLPASTTGVVILKTPAPREEVAQALTPSLARGSASRRTGTGTATRSPPSNRT